MFTRCYNKDFHVKYSTYVVCEVSPEWHDFQVFAEWFEKTKPEGDYQLDKDLLFKGNKIYGETTCLWLPRKLNQCINLQRGSRGGYPVGVSYDSRYHKLEVRCADVSGRRAFLGFFTDKTKAFNKYKEFKKEILDSLANDAYHNSQIDERTYLAVLNFKIEIGD